MDAPLISEKLKAIWAEHAIKSSGTINKIPGMKVQVWTEYGYREVIGLCYNNDLKSIELVLDDK